MKFQLVGFLISYLIGITSNSIKNAYPKTLDWSKHPVGDGGFIDLTGPVHYEGECGACWAIGVAVVMDTKFNMALLDGMNTTAAVELSDQNLVHCAVGGGCEGGEELDAANYAITNGITTEQCYPYNPTSGLACEPDLICGHEKPLYFAKSHREITVNNGKDPVTEDVIIAELQNGPVCADVDLRDEVSQKAHGGILRATDYTQDQKDAWEIYNSVVIVGYGEEEYPVSEDNQTLVLTKWWNIKNSFGVGWGDNGHQKIQRGVNLLLIEDLITTIDIDLERSWGFGYNPKPPANNTPQKKITSLDIALFVVVGILALLVIVMILLIVVVVVMKNAQLAQMRSGGLYGKMEIQQQPQQQQQQQGLNF